MTPPTGGVTSFDVFDTLLTRRVGAPRAVFPLVADRLAAAGVPLVSREAFATARERVEERLARLRGRQPTLAEIAEELTVVLGLDPGLASVVEAAEQACERDLVVAMPSARGMVEEARRAGPVVFVSDTPHPESFVRELLQGSGLAKDGDRVFASSDRRATKVTGKLFDVVAAELGVDPRAILHRGDNEMVDVASARERGWRAEHLPGGRLDRYEHLLEADAVATAGLTSWLAGSSRLARLAAVDRGVPAAIAGVASGVVTPLLVGYALWLGAQARVRGLRRLYFVARDGEVMLEVARTVLGQVAPEIECRYLYGSRQAWVFPAGVRSGAMLQRWLDFPADMTPRAAVARAGLDLDEAFGLSGCPVADPARPEGPMRPDERDTLRAALLGEPLVEVLRERAEEQARLVAEYVRQEGFADGVPSALVDAGWRGSTAQAFDEILRDAGCTPVVHLFMGLSAHAAEVRRAEPPPTMVAWLVDEADQRGADRQWSGANVVLEVFCAGTEGRVEGYRRQDGHVLPVLERPRNDDVLAWGLSHVRAVVRQATELTVPHLAATSVHADLSGVVMRLLSCFWRDPTPSESRAWGSFPWQDETWPPFYPVAEPISTRTALRILALGEARIRRNSSWRAGTAALSPAPWSTVLRLRGWHQQHESRMKRIPRRLRLEVHRRRG